MNPKLPIKVESKSQYENLEAIVDADGKVLDLEELCRSVNTLHAVAVAAKELMQYLDAVGSMTTNATALVPLDTALAAWDAYESGEIESDHSDLKGMVNDK